MYPNDEQFEETTIESVEAHKGGGWSIGMGTGFHISVPADSPIEPKEGMVVRLYGKGIGFAVRGMFLDGQKVYYRNEAEEKDRREVEMFGADAADWLARWDAGKTVWSIEMGGLGPGYEQCIHITAAEILRHLLAEKYDAARWEHPPLWKDDREAIEKYGFANPVIEKLGLSGAQWGAAMSLATSLYMTGPRDVMTKPELKDRHIQVRRDFPQAVPA